MSTTNDNLFNIDHGSPDNNQLVIHDILNIDIHLYLHQYDDIDPATYHHHHGPAANDILIHDDDCAPDHNVYVNLYGAALDYHLYGPRDHDHRSDSEHSGDNQHESAVSG